MYAYFMIYSFMRSMFVVLATHKPFLTAMYIRSEYLLIYSNRSYCLVHCPNSLINESPKQLVREHTYNTK